MAVLRLLHLPWVDWWRLLLLCRRWHRCETSAESIVFAEFYVVLKGTRRLLLIVRCESHRSIVHIFGVCCRYYRIVIWSAGIWIGSVEHRIYQCVQFKIRVWWYCIAVGPLLATIADVIVGAAQNLVQVSLGRSQWICWWLAWSENGFVLVNQIHKRFSFLFPTHHYCVVWDSSISRQLV